jgi:indolepyruvate ferredoxin oxidoreductase beta subunit
MTNDERPMTSVRNIVLAGIGGQGIVKASDILADAAFRAGHDVKKAEVHGMSQRGGSVTTDVRYGPAVVSPMVPDGEADILVVMEPTQVENNRHRLRPGGVLLTTDALAGVPEAAGKSANVAMLGLLSRHLDLPEAAWLEAIRAALPPKTHAANLAAFAAVRALRR